MPMQRKKVHILFEHSYDLRPFGSAFIRLLRPLTHTSLQEHVDTTFGPNPIDQWTDITILDRLWQPDVSMKLIENLLEEIYKTSNKFVYSLDDSYFDLPLEHSDQLTPEKLAVAKYLLQQADCVIVTTRFLKERFQEYNANIIVIPNALDERLLVPRMPASFDPPFPKRRKTIGYMGTLTHDEDLLMVLPALETVCQNHPNEIVFEIIGGIANLETRQKLETLPVRYTAPHPEEHEYPLFMLWYTGQTRWDLAIAPLKDTSFNQAKSDIKFLDYCAIGAPGIYSAVPAYQSSVRHSETGWLVENQIDVWIEALETLITEDELRAQLAQNAYRYLYSERTLAQTSKNWLQAIDHVLGQ
jgi:glycosyltransferase involved in cell wall biosynthesis